MFFHFTELIISPYSNEQPPLTCNPIFDNSILPKMDKNGAYSTSEKSLLSCAKNFSTNTRDFKVSTNLPRLFLNELYYENFVQKIAGYFIPIVLGVFTSLVFGSEYLDRMMTIENVAMIVGGLLVGLFLIRILL